MKLLLFALFCFPLFTKAQYIGGSLDSAKELVPIVKSYLLFDLNLLSDSTEAELLSYGDETQFCKIRIGAKTTSKLEGTTVVKSKPVVTGLYIQGPADRIDKLMAEFFTPMAKKYADYKAKDLWATFNGLQIVCQDGGKRQDIPLKIITLSKE